jgi:hypothetical protein
MTQVTTVLAFSLVYDLNFSIKSERLRICDGPTKIEPAIERASDRGKNN